MYIVMPPPSLPGSILPIGIRVGARQRDVLDRQTYPCSGFYRGPGAVASRENPDGDGLVTSDREAAQCVETARRNGAS
jgi:hypothetical protein